MRNRFIRHMAISAAIAISIVAAEASAHKLREAGAAVEVADSNVLVTPTRDWNRVSGRIGKNVETWTLDGTQLNDVTFFAGIAVGNPLVKERSKKHEPLPKFTKDTLLIEIPELLEGTYRPYKRLATFEIRNVEPTEFLGHDGILFAYRYSDRDGLTKLGEASASIIGGKLYMITYDAPRIYYFERSLEDFRTLLRSARLS